MTSKKQKCIVKQANAAESTLSSVINWAHEPHSQQEKSPIRTVQLQRLIGNQALSKVSKIHAPSSTLQRMGNKWQPPRPIGFVRAKRKHIKWSKGEMGHWWTEIRTSQGEESYGWWPKSQGTVTDALLGTEGELNAVSLGIGGTTVRDPYHGDRAEESLIPVTTNKQKKDAQIISDLRRFAHSYKGSWRWSLGGTDCHTFQEKLLEAADLRLPTLRESVWMFLSPPPSQKPRQNIDYSSGISSSISQSKRSEIQRSNYNHRKCECGKDSVGHTKCKECQREEQPTLHRAFIRQNTYGGNNTIHRSICPESCEASAHNGRICKSSRVVRDNCINSNAVNPRNKISHIRVELASRRVTLFWNGTPRTTSGRVELLNCTPNPEITPRGWNTVGKKCGVKHTSWHRSHMAWFTAFASTGMEYGFHNSQPLGAAYRSSGCVRLTCEDARKINQNSQSGWTSIIVR